MKLTIIGHFCFDVFHRVDGTEERQFGGIYHSVAALANLASERDTIFPVFGIGKKDEAQLRSEFSQYKNIDLSGLFVFEGETNTVHYYNDSPNERSLDIAAPIPFKHIKQFLNVDGVYVNMISGKDIVVDTIDEIRLEIRSKKVPLHLDLHCLTLSVNPDGTREHKAMADWRRWCFMTESVQLNDEEAREMSVEGFNDELLAKQIIPLMVKAFIITRGAKGATLFQEQHKQLSALNFAEELDGVPFSTLGSGDIFGISFLYSVLKKKSYAEAAQFAQKTASHSTKFNLADKHRELKAMREML